MSAGRVGAAQDSPTRCEPGPRSAALQNTLPNLTAHDEHAAMTVDFSSTAPSAHPTGFSNSYPRQQMCYFRRTLQRYRTNGYLPP